MSPRKKTTRSSKSPRAKRRRESGTQPPKLFILSIVLNVCFIGYVGWGLLWGDFAAVFKPAPGIKKTASTTAAESASSSEVPVIEKAWMFLTGERELSDTTSKLVFVIDDMGHTRDNESFYRSLGDRLTYAILPFLEYSEYFAKFGHKQKATIMLHLPLEASDHTFPGPGLITTRMTDDNVRDLLARNLKEVPYHAGVNSHMGSHGTTDYRLMKVILWELKKKKLFFLDSYTTADSVASQAAAEVGIPVLKRDVFLDNVDEPGAIKKRVIELAALARTNGYAIGIGHDRRNTLTVLADLIPRLEKDGFEVVGLQDLIKYFERKDQRKAG